MAQKDAGLADSEYRQILFQVAGITSCKDLDSSQVVDVMNAIREYNADETSALPGKKKKGWQPKQIRKWRQYVKYCKITGLEAGTILHKIAGIADCESPQLKQVDFDVAMAAIEYRLTDGDGPLPAGIDPHYWRTRKPNPGKVSTREIWEIREKWYELEQLLSPEARTDDYLLGFIRQTCHYDKNQPLEEMTSRDALKAVEALKKRIKQCERKLEAAPF